MTTAVAEVFNALRHFQEAVHIIIVSFGRKDVTAEHDACINSQKCRRPNVYSPILPTALPYSSSDAIILTLPLPSVNPPAGLVTPTELCLTSGGTPLSTPLPLLPLPVLELRPLRLLALRLTLTVLGSAGREGEALPALLYGTTAALLPLLLLLKLVPAGTRARDSTWDLNVGEAVGVVTALLELVLRRNSLSLIFRSSEETDSSPGMMRCNRS